MQLVNISVRRKHLTALKFSEPYLPEGAKPNEEGVLLIDSDLCIEKRLNIGMQLDSQDIDELFLESEKRRAKSYALWLLSRRDYSSGEMHKKINQKHSESVSDYTVCRMVELGLIDDVTYAKRLAESLINEKGVAPRQAVYLMANKGVDLQLAKEVLAERADDPRENIKRLVDTKYARKLRLEGGAEKVFSALIRKGFSYEDVRSVLSQLTENEYFDG